MSTFPMTSPSNDRPTRNQAEAQSQRLLNETRFERDRLAALLASIQDEVWFADTQGRFTLANPAALKELAAKLPIDVKQLALGLEVFSPDGSPRPIEASPALRALNGRLHQDGRQLSVNLPSEPRIVSLNSRSVGSRCLGCASMSCSMT